MLETLGLDSLSEQVYRSMLSHRDEGVAELAARLGTDEAEIRKALDSLSALSLVYPSQAEASRFDVMPPAIAMELLLSRQQARLAAEQLKVEASRVAAAQLIAEYSSVRAREQDSDHEYLFGVQAIRIQLERLGELAEREVMNFAPGGAHSASDLKASQQPNSALLERGVRIRTIYLDSVRNDQATLQHISWLAANGGEVRTTPSLPTRLIIVDQSQALLPVNLADARMWAVITRNEGILEALCALFEYVWAAATPFGTKPVVKGPDLTPQQMAVLTQLATGITDEAIAKRLGISTRTARRTTADLMELLNAHSRFEAGVRAVQTGWLPSDNH